MEDIIFRGSNLEIKVRIHDNLLSSIRSINDPLIEIGETVNVFIYRMYLIKGEDISIVENESIRQESVFI